MGVGAALLLVAGVVYNFFNKPQYKPLAVPAPLQSVVAQAARSVRLNTRSVDQHTTLALMTMTSSKASKGFKSPVFSEQCDQTGITLSRYMLEVARANPDMVELESVFSSIQTACKTISKLVKRSAIDGMTGYAGGGGSINVQGEEQKKLDVITNEVLKKALKFTGRMGVIASEEEDTPVAMDNSLDESYGKDVLVEEGGKYVSVFDPLDGSSNIDAGIPVGTIFGIYEEDGDCVLPDDYFEGGNNLADAMKDCLKSTLKPGNSLVSSGYCLYSSATHFVFTLGDGVQGFTLDDSIGEFILTHPNITVPPRGKIYSINEANRPQWDGPMTKWIDGLAAGTNKSGVAYSSRYIGSMVGDVHRTLLYGGVFAYPGDSKNPNGKLRLLYEVAPMSFLIEQAGGAATTGMARCMDLPPKDVHQRVPLIMGGKDEISELEEIYKNEAPEELKEAQLARLTY
uniref:fructose-bisphosphatase n=2 Tax=Eutreptiella gymnastica TaxID=73025 RepID=A0A6U7TSN8_9EUGL